jgi:NAD-dependent dihydropyrimidine dehydrogenase PreA subunit
VSKTWYPVIDYEKCVECGICTGKCRQGVYDKEKAPRPVVVRPEACDEECAGCGDICPYGAIEYFGDRELAAVVYGGGCGGCGNERERGCGGCKGCGGCSRK